MKGKGPLHPKTFVSPNSQTEACGGENMSKKVNAMSIRPPRLPPAAAGFEFGVTLQQG